MKNTLYVITVVSNPLRYRSRYKLYREFAERIHAAGATLITVEAAFADRPYEVTHKDNPHHVQVRTKNELWNKENLINIGLQHLPEDWEYVAWIDADVLFARPDWVKETIHQLHHYQVVQLFSETIDIDDNFNRITSNGSIPMKGMVYQYHKTGVILNDYNKHSGHCGYAWAATRHAMEVIDGLIDFSIVGSGDFQMACGFMDDIRRSVSYPCSPEYINALVEWGEKAKKLRRNIGYVHGLLIHNYHGKKSNRSYGTRWKILVDNQYNPYTDLRKDWQGLNYLVDDGSDRYISLRDELKDYFRSRDEDEPAPK